METKQLIKNITAELKDVVKGHPCHRSFHAYRCAGGLEMLLVNEGFLKVEEKFEYQTGGKKYIPLIGDFRWTESYPHFILRKAEEYLETFKAQEIQDEAMRVAYRKGWVLTGHAGVERYWWNHARNERREIDWEKPFIEQIPTEGVEA